MEKICRLSLVANSAQNARDLFCLEEHFKALAKTAGRVAVAGPLETKSIEAGKPTRVPPSQAEQFLLQADQARVAAISEMGKVVGHVQALTLQLEKNGVDLRSNAEAAAIAAQGQGTVIGGQ